MNLKQAILDPIYQAHNIGDKYTMDKKPDNWQLVYYPIFTNNKTKEIYKEPRALMQNIDKSGFWHKEVPLRYLKKQP